MIISRKRFHEEIEKAIAEMRRAAEIEAWIRDVQHTTTIEFEQLWKAIRKLEVREMTGKEAQKDAQTD